MSKTWLRTLLTPILAALLFCVQGATASAQGTRTSRNAALQARERILQRHRQTGSIGNGFRPWSAWTYQQSANSHVQALHSYGRTCSQLPAATASEHLSAIQQNVAATRKEIAKLGEEAAKEAGVHEKVVALQKHLEECEKLCGMMSKTITEDGVETVQMCAHCSGLEAKLKAAETEHQALLKELGIAPPASAAAHGDHEHEHKADAQSEKK